MTLNFHAVKVVHFIPLQLVHLKPLQVVHLFRCTQMAAAYNGAVTYTAAISKGEKLIARTIREQGYPLVVLLNEGFPKEGSLHERHYKPGGVYFEACAKGQLLLLEPTEQTITNDTVVMAVQQTLLQKAESRHYSYSAIPTTTARYRFVALNEIAKRLAL